MPAFTHVRGDVVVSGTTTLRGPVRLGPQGERTMAGIIVDAGVRTLTAGTASVAAPLVRPQAMILLTRQSVGGTPGDAGVTAKQTGVGFTITSLSPTDTSTYAWFLIEAP